MKIPTSKTAYNILRLGLLISGLGWGIAFSFTFATWSVAADYMYTMGAGVVKYHPLLDYWLRMASVVFGCVGLASFLAAWKPQSYFSVIRLLGPFHIFLGVVLWGSAINNGLNSDEHPTFIVDITFCFLVSILVMLPILITQKPNGTDQQDLD